MIMAKQQISTDKLMQDLRLVMQDAEELLKATAGQAGEKVSAARARAEDSIRMAKEALGEIGEDALERTRDAAASADEYVHRNPWTAVGIAAGIGLVVGLLLSRK
jgi:ElaB/YqjD/DUF883 family membrane-anchored ribosome-binding protein